MALDPSVILQGQAPQIQNPLTAATQAATMSNLMQEHQSNAIKLGEEQRVALENQTVRDALKNNTQTDPNGNPVVDRAGTVGDLMKAGMVQKAQDLQLNWRQMDLQKVTQQHEIAGPIVMSIDPKDPTSWENAKNKSAEMGLPPIENQLPPFSSPNFPTALRNFQKQYLTTGQALEQQNKQVQFRIDQQKADASTQEARVKAFEAGMPVGSTGAPSNASAPAAGAAPGPYGGNPPPKVQNDGMNQYLGKTDTSRQPPDISQAYKDVQSSDKINRLFADTKGNFDNMNKGQVILAATEMSKLAGGGAPTQTEIEELTPNTLVQKYGSTLQNLTGKSTPQNAGEFMKQLQEYANGIGSQGISRIQANKNEVADNLRQQMGEKQYANVKNQIANEFKNNGSLTWKLQRLKELQAKKAGSG